MLHIPATTMFPAKKGGAAVAPIEIGTHGTVGNLVMKEIKYSKRLELDHGDGGDHLNSEIISLDPEKHGGGVGGSIRLGFGFLKITWPRKKKKRKGGNSDKFLPRICMKVDVAESHHNHGHRANKLPGFNYQNLQADAK